MGQHEEERAFAACLALLRRGILSGGDASEYLDVFGRAIGAVGVSLAEGFRFAVGGALRDLPAEWPATHAAVRHEDPSPRWLDASGPYAVYSVERQTPGDAWRRSALLDAFDKAGFRDGAITRIGSARRGWLYLAAYRPRPLEGFDDTALSRLMALLPWMDLAFGPSRARRALDASPYETHRQALSRLGTYAIVDPAGRAATYWSPRARALLAATFDGFGERMQARFEGMLRDAYRRFVEGRGPRSVRVHAMLDVELGLYPQPGKDALILASVTSPPAAHAAAVENAFEELLSPRQREVARRAASGASIPSIARAISTKPDTVKEHLGEVYRRLGVASRAELAVLYAREGRD